MSTRGSAWREVWQRQVRRAEDLGYATVLIPDHVWTPMAPIAALAIAAEATTTLRLGTLVFGNDFRHPVILAKEAATLDVFSGGRLELGLGSGWQLSDYETLGIPFDPPGVRISRFAEAVQILRGSFVQDPFSFSGDHYSVSNFRLLPKPIQRAGPPILIGGGSRRILSIAGRYADIVGLNHRATAAGDIDASDITAEGTTQKVAWVREAAGERFREVELSVMISTLAVTAGDRGAAASSLLEARGLADKLTVDQLLGAPQALVGSISQIVETLQSRREQFGISYIVVREADEGSEISAMESFAPVVARLAGK